MTVSASRPRIVVVEDNHMNMRLLCEVVLLSGFEPVCSVDGADIERLVEGAAPVLVLMDIQLPGPSGVELMRRLRAHGPTAALPIHAVTAFADPRSAERFLDEGFDGVIAKPVNMGNLMSLLRAVRPCGASHMHPDGIAG